MSKGFVAKQSVRVRASAAKVWDALVDPAAVKQYMFGHNAVPAMIATVFSRDPVG